MWKVTHVDAEGARRRVTVAAANGRLAEAWAIQLFGLPRWLGLIRLSAPRD